MPRPFSSCTTRWQCRGDYFTPATNLYFILFILRTSTSRWSKMFFFLWRPAGLSSRCSSSFLPHTLLPPPGQASRHQGYQSRARARTHTPRNLAQPPAPWATARAQRMQLSCCPLLCVRCETGPAAARTTLSHCVSILKLRVSPHSSDSLHLHSKSHATYTYRMFPISILTARVNSTARACGLWSP